MIISVNKAALDKIQHLFISPLRKREQKIIPQFLEDIYKTTLQLNLIVEDWMCSLYALNF